MALYTYAFVGLDKKRVIDTIAASTASKITFGPVTPTVTVSFDSGGSVLSSEEEADIDGALQREGWEFVSKT